MEISAPKIELDSEELETTLWRYMNFPKFVSMLDRQGLWLARSDTFRDLHEGRFPDDMKRHKDQVYKELEQKKEVSKKIRGTADFQEHLRKNMFLSCWHKNTEENMVMWELYGRDRNATVAIQTTAKIIQESIKKECPSPSAMTPFHGLIIKNVAYQEADEPLKVMRYEDCFFRKRRHFQFEKEVRILLNTYDKHSPSLDTPVGHLLKADINQLVTKILVHPDCDDWFLDVVTSVVKKYGVKVKVVVSKGKYGHH